MRKGLCVYPGSFDPVTVGHADLIGRASKLFDSVIVVVLHNPSKRGCFTVEERVNMLMEVCSRWPNVKTDRYDGLLVEYVKKQDAGVVLRGLRAMTDISGEYQMAQVNRHMAPETETLFLMAAVQYAHISSSIVREVGGFGGDISAFVPAAIAQQVYERLRPRGRL